MTLRDLLIIYLACGAPFGVYFFLQNRNRTETKILWLKTLLRFIFWIPFAFRMVAQTSLLTNLYNLGFAQAGESDAIKELEIEEIKKIFETNLSQNVISLFEFREIYDRYVGLSVEIQNTSKEIAPAEQEIFRITNHNNKKLGEVCLNRRNRKRLVFHQKLARRDFVEIFKRAFEKSVNSQSLLNNALRLTALVEDFEASKMFEKLANEFLQTRQNRTVSQLEKEQWKSDKHRQPADNNISTNLQPLTATANLSTKD